ncbi:mechanosensitive ion channel [Methylobrevis sp. L22]|uniref:Small-conductance mechanosensitive channel n=1 Tax=Methylobrevis albus TaxID=2793297 RepID=A0A931MZN3_9HYPH|nr:mechanosensitive ion channel [Methylobrevis albus]
MIAWSIAFVPHLVAAIVIFVVGLFVAGWVSRGVSGLLGRAPHVDPTVRPVVAAVLRYGIIVFVIILSLSQLGVQTASLFAILGAAGLAIGLALQGTLTNIAAGVMLLWLRPFKIGDYIEVGAVAGTVREIGLFVCELETFDGIYVLAPNSSIWNLPLRNHGRNGRRMVSLATMVPKDADLAAAVARLNDVVAADGRVLAEPAPVVFVDGFTGAGTNVVTRFWTTTANFAEVQRTIIAEGVAAFGSAAQPAEMPVQMTRTIPPDADPSRLIVRNDKLAVARRP